MVPPNSTSQSASVVDLSGKWKENIVFPPPLDSLLTEMHSLCSSLGGFAPQNVTDESITVRKDHSNNSKHEENEEKPQYISSDLCTVTQQMDLFFQFWQKLEEDQIDKELASTHQEWKWLEDTFAALQTMQHAHTEAIAHFDLLKNRKLEVQGGVDGLYSTCDSLLNEKKLIENTIQALKSRLSFYTRLEDIRKKLDSPSICLEPELLNRTIIRLDESVEFFDLHSDYFEASHYLAEYEKLRLQASNLIQTAVTQMLNRCEAIIEKLKQEQTAVAVTFQLDVNLYYKPFKSAGPAIKGLITIIHQRAEVASHDTYSDKLDQIEGVYVSLRIRIISNLLQAYLETSIRIQSSLSSAIRHATNYILSVGDLELSTFYALFVPRASKQSLKILLETFGGIYYDCLRPAILACDSIDELREAADGLSFDILEPHAHFAKNTELAPLLSIILRLQKDVQERLIFCVETYVRDEILHFQPSENEIDYPKRLLISIQNPQQADAVDPTADWYPTLRQSLLILSKIHQTLEPSIFQSIAHETVAACFHTLVDASKKINKIEGKELDAQLFLIKYVLTLREQISAFHCDFINSNVSVDFGSVRNRLYDLLFTRDRLYTSFIAPSAFFSSFSFNFRETRTDLKQDLELSLKQTCEAFVSNAVTKLVSPLFCLSSSLFMEPSPSLLASSSNNIVENKKQVQELDTTTLHATMREAFQHFWGNLATELPFILQLMRLYLDSHQLPSSQTFQNVDISSMEEKDSTLLDTKEKPSPPVVSEKVGILFSPIRSNILATAEHIETYMKTKLQLSPEEMLALSWLGLPAICKQIDLSLDQAMALSSSAICYYNAISSSVPPSRKDPSSSSSLSPSLDAVASSSLFKKKASEIGKWIVTPQGGVSGKNEEEEIVEFEVFEETSSSLNPTLTSTLPPSASAYEKTTVEEASE